jgi:glucose uptake protein GlcU
MENINYTKEPVLLPGYFKMIGIAVMILAFAVAISFKSMNVALGIEQKELLRELTMNAFILGLLFLVTSRDKVEDELTLLIRLKSMSWTFVWAVFLVIVTPIIDLLFDDAIEPLSGQQVVGSMLCGYLIMYNWQKRNR